MGLLRALINLRQLQVRIEAQRPVTLGSQIGIQLPGQIRPLAGKVLYHQLVGTGMRLQLDRLQ